MSEVKTCEHKTTRVLWEESASSRDIGEIRWCVNCGAFREWHGSSDPLAQWTVPQNAPKPRPAREPEKLVIGCGDERDIETLTRAVAFAIDAAIDDGQERFSNEMAARIVRVIFIDPEDATREALGKLTTPADKLESEPHSAGARRRAILGLKLIEAFDGEELSRIADKLEAELEDEPDARSDSEYGPLAADVRVMADALTIEGEQDDGLRHHRRVVPPDCDNCGATDTPLVLMDKLRHDRKPGRFSEYLCPTCQPKPICPSCGEEKPLIKRAAGPDLCDVCCKLIPT